MRGFEDRAQAEAANERALTWIKDNMGDLVTKPLHVIKDEIKVRLRATVGAR